MKFAKKKNTLNCDKSSMNLYIVTFTKHCKFYHKNETTFMYNRLVCRGSKITQLIRNMKTYINLITGGILNVSRTNLNALLNVFIGHIKCVITI